MVQAFIIKQWKWFVMAGLGLACVWLLNWGNSQLRAKWEAEAAMTSAIRISNSSQTEAKFYKNKYNDQVQVTQAEVLSKKHIKEAAEIKEAAFLKRFYKVDRDYKNLLSAQSIGVRITPENLPRDTFRVPCKDSIKVTHYLKKDKWNNIDAQVVGVPTFQVRDSVYVGIFWGRKWFLGRRKFTGQLIHMNTDMVDMKNEVTIVQKRK